MSKEQGLVGKRQEKEEARGSILAMVYSQIGATVIFAPPTDTLMSTTINIRTERKDMHTTPEQFFYCIINIQ